MYIITTNTYAQLICDIRVVFVFKIIF